jgi:hypothetical protein
MADDDISPGEAIPLTGGAIPPTLVSPPTATISLSTIGPSSAGSGGASSGPSAPTAVSVSPDFSLDRTRQYIAFALLGILGLIILVELISSAVLATGCWNTAKPDGTGMMACPQAQASLGVLTSVLGTVFTAMIGLVGSVVGFYFGSQKANPTP